MTNYRLKTPVLTVYMPVFNADKFVANAIESILTQSYKNFEFIIVDDASTDSTWKIIRAYARKDKRIRPYKNSINLGVSLTANIAISHARGKFLARIDADDIAFPDRLEKQINFLKNHREVVAAGGQCITIDSDNLIIGHKKFPTLPRQLEAMLFWAIPIQQASMMVNLSKLPKTFTWYEKDKSSAEEVSVMFNLLRYGNLVNLSDYILYYRQLPNSLSHQNPRQTYYLTMRSRLKALYSGHRPTFIALLVNLIQFVAINLLPTPAVNTLWGFLRGINSSGSKFTVGTLATAKV